MFVPISDENPLRSISFQWVTLLLIAVNVACFVVSASGVPEPVLASLAVVPRELLDAGLRGAASYPHKFSVIAVNEHWTLLSYMFLHGNALHLLGNILFLWVFGDNVEDALGHVTYLVFYLACGVAAALFHTAIMPGSEAPLIGASGAVAGIVAAYVILHPHVRLWVLVLRFIPLQVSALYALGAWIVLQFVMPFIGDGTPTAWWAHVGGILAGAVLILVLPRNRPRPAGG